MTFTLPDFSKAAPVEAPLAAKEDVLSPTQETEQKVPGSF